MGFARQVASRIIFMDEGHIVENCSRDEFFSGAHSDRAKAFLSKILNH
jgi:glutamate/aspartate transport system ATP-binding protein